MTHQNHDVLSRRSVHQALKSWRHAGQLGEHPLAELSLVDARRRAASYDASPTGYGMAVRDVLRAALDGLRPDDAEPDPLDKRWRYYICLSERFVFGRSPDYVADHLGIARSTYDHTQNAAIEALSDVLRQREEASREPASVDRPPLPADRAPFLAPPRPAHPLVGRDDLLHSLAGQLVAGPQRVALYGLPGVGKTALALHLASDPAVLAHFEDGILWAALGRTPNLPGLLGSWGMALGLSSDDLSRMPRTEDRMRALRALIGRRCMLLIIDDAWQVDDATAFMVGGPECAYLLTTRQPSVAIDFAGDATVRVPELELDAGLALLALYVPDLITSEPRRSARLVDAAGGLPLGLTLMGQYLRKESHAGQPRRLRAALDRLQTTEERLLLTQPGAAPDQQPSLDPGTPLSLRNVLNLSADSLDAPAQAALCALSIFPPKPNTFSEAAALAISGDGVEALDVLADAGLLEVAASGRYALHPTIAEYARLKRDESAEDVRPLLARMAGYFVPYLELHTGMAGSDYDLLDLELENMLAALDAAYESGEGPALISGANALCDYLESRGLYALAETHLQRAEQAARDLPDIPGLGRTLTSLGRIAQRLGAYERAEQCFEEGLELLEAGGAPEQIADLLQGRGVIAFSRGDYARAELCFNQGLELARSTGQPARISALLANAGTLMFSRGDAAGGEACFEEGLRLARQAGLRARVSVLLTNLGVIAARRGLADTAEAYFRESLSIAQDLGHRENVLFLLTNLGTLASERGEHSQAEATFQEALVLARSIGQRARISHLLANLGTLATHRGEYEQAEAYLQEGLALAREMAQRDMTILHLINLGALEIARQDAPQAAVYLEEALSTARAMGHRQYICASLNTWGDAYLMEGQTGEAEAVFTEALEMARAIGVELFAATALYGLARASAVRGAHAEAADLAHQALLIFERIGNYRAAEVRAWLAAAPSGESGD